MRQVLLSFLITVFMFSVFPVNLGVSAVPSGSLNGLVSIDVNVTIVNTAPFPKFIVLNPNYLVSVHRLGNNESTPGFEDNPRMVYNYNPGIWVMPYEVVEINFKINRTESYQLPQVPCSGEGGTSLACGIVVPQLVNSPSQLSARSMFPLIDGHIKILDYEGFVRFVVSSPDDRFLKSFVLTVPVLFVDGKMYDFQPKYTTDYRGYLEMVYNYTGLRKHTGFERTDEAMPMEMFQLTSTLLSGITVPKGPDVVPSHEGYNLPVWFVTTTKEVEITYRVKWKNGGS